MDTKAKKSFPLREFLLLGTALFVLTLIVLGLTGGLLSGDATRLLTSTSQIYPPPSRFGEAPDSGNSLTPTRTATPINPTIDPNWTPPPTENPILYSEVIDLSPGLTENEEYFVFVQKETGEYVIFTIGPVISSYRDELPQEVAVQIPLGPKDILLRGVPFYPGRHSLAEIMGHTPTATLNPYPFGWTPAPTTTPSPTLNPYP